MPPVVILQQPLTNLFVPSAPFLIVERLAISDFALSVSAGPASVEWYFELTSSAPNTLDWFREVDETSPGTGVIILNPVTRNFGALAASLTPYRFDVQAVKAHGLARIQIRAAAGQVSAVLSTPFGLPAQQPG